MSLYKFTNQLVETIAAEWESVVPLKLVCGVSQPITKWLPKEATASKRERRCVKKGK